MSAYLATRLQEYYAARDAWLSARERACNGYATEEHAYALSHPRPTWREWLTDGRSR